MLICHSIVVNAIDVPGWLFKTFFQISKLCVNLCMICQTMCKSLYFVQIMALIGFRVLDNCFEIHHYKRDHCVDLYDRFILLVIVCNFSYLTCLGSTEIDIGSLLYPDQKNITQVEGRFDEFYQALLTRNYTFGKMPQTPGGNLYSRPIGY